MRLAAIAASGQRDARYWVAQTALRAAEIREEALSRLAERGILERHEGRFLWVFRSRRYPVIDGKAPRRISRRSHERRGRWSGPRSLEAR